MLIFVSPAKTLDYESPLPAALPPLTRPDFLADSAELIAILRQKTPAEIATLMSLSRLARLGRARVVPVVSRLTREGYEVTVMSPWANYPTDDPEADTAAMNLYLEGFIRRAPEQYYWVHKRFKTRPEGEPSFYADL